MTANWANHRINDHQSSAPVIPLCPTYSRPPRFLLTIHHSQSTFLRDPPAHRVSCSQFTIHSSQFSGILRHRVSTHNSQFTILPLLLHHTYPFSAIDTYSSP